MGSKFETRLLGELCHEITVGFVGSMTNEYIETGIPFLRSKNIDEYNVKWDDMKYVSSEFHKKLSKSALKPGDVAIVRTGKPGTTCVIPDSLHEANCSDIVIARVNNELLCPHYLSYFMNAMAHGQINAHVVGAVQQHFNVSSAKKIEIPLPSRFIQTEIVQVLKALDDKLRLNRQINQTLEQMAQALFKSWFVDFDPVVDNALDAGFFEQNSDLPEELLSRAEQRKIVREQPDFKPLPAETCQLFPAEFEECGEPSLGLSGWVPKGWKVGTLGDVLSLRNERTKPSAETQNIPYVPVECISTKEPFLSEFKSGDEAMSSLILFKKGDVLFGAMRPYFHKVCIAPFDGVTRSTVFTLTARDTESRYFSLFQAYQESTIEYATLHSEGSTIPYAKWRGSLERQPIILPTSQLQRLFHERIKLSIEWGDLNNKQSKTLSNLRDTLLPKLISGELRLSDDGTLASGNTDC
ncbi:restriction endonuclease subunit S [Plesiomonas shigelloides]|uniref:restriction endonuclease subunit S n=1 Tax=Plesiomonas shigelloides TaxID=703 RepID=UPI00126215A6|nr:restriction endonuclease subunit S [Plesiomonas shigelloides]KAB7702223.1 restriction endonuclease subunit S [Plesiomonas shigelloides]